MSDDLITFFTFPHTLLTLVFAGPRQWQGEAVQDTLGALPHLRCVDCVGGVL